MITFTITNKHRPKATVIMIVSFGGRCYRKSIGVGLPVKLWNEKKHRAKVTNDFDGNFINLTIDHYEAAAKKVLVEMRTADVFFSTQEFNERLSALISVEPSGVEASSDYLLSYFDNVYYPRYKKTKSTISSKRLATSFNKLRDFEANKRKFRFEDIDISFYNSFKTWFYKLGFSANYFGSVIKHVKQVITEARLVDKLHNFDGIQHKDFIIISETADTVYLNEEELNIIFNLNITPELINSPSLSQQNIDKKIKALERARNLFLIGCYTGLRVSDFSRLRDVHISKHITIKTAKTGAKVVIPIHPVVRAIINNGFDFKCSVSSQKLNVQIKELCRLSGICEFVLINKNEGGVNKEKEFCKYQLISSHTARRSFATNAYKAGVPTMAIMKVTGHTKESTFLKYIKVSQEENADLLSLHSFFN